MTFEQIKVFSEVCRCQSITKAADNLHLSRQCVSITLKKLEQSLMVPLLVRSVNGVTPTPAGKEFLHYANDVLASTYVIKENMKTYITRTNNIMTTCNISLGESILLSYGQQLYEILSNAFPQIYFILTPFRINNTSSLDDYDIIIAILSIEQVDFLTKKLTDTHSSIEISSSPVYAWVSAKSAWSKCDHLSLKTLQNAPFCSLKNSYNKEGFIHHLTHYVANNNIINDEIYLENSFIDCIEKFGYYTLDVAFLNNALFYSNLFKKHDIVLKNTQTIFYSKLIYNKETSSNIYPIILNFFGQYLNLN